MDTKQIIKRLADSTDKTSQEIEDFIETFSSVVKEKCVEMDSIAIPGFGTFEPRKRLERITLHPSTGKRILIPPKITLSFKMSAIIKQQLKENIK